MEGTGHASFDHFKVPLLKDVEYRIELKGNESSDPGGTLPNPAVSLMGIDGLILTEGEDADLANVITGDKEPQARDEDSGNGNNAKLEIKMNTTGTYLIAVDSESRTGTYTLVVTTK